MLIILFYLCYVWQLYCYVSYLHELSFNKITTILLQFLINKTFTGWIYHIGSESRDLLTFAFSIGSEDKNMNRFSPSVHCACWLVHISFILYYDWILKERQVEYVFNVNTSLKSFWKKSSWLRFQDCKITLEVNLWQASSHLPKEETFYNYADYRRLPQIVTQVPHVALIPTFTVFEGCSETKKIIRNIYSRIVLKQQSQDLQ